ncbi:hypothetical protein KAI10_08265 [Candidatus Bathyarchaeota archaeon]|nr:hypothetical protein [Candidatus Bathyarchaeota archaeon]
MNGVQVSSVRNNILIALGWAVFLVHIQFNMLITEGTSIMPVWFLMMFFVSLLASSLLENLDKSLKTWISSILLSALLSVVLISSPAIFGVLDQQFVSVMIAGSIQPIMTVLLLTAPVGLLGCFLGQSLRNRLS